MALRALAVLALALGVLAPGRVAGAQALRVEEPRALVLVLASPAETISPELLATLEIQLADVEVRPTSAELTGELATDLPLASALLERERGTLVVWLTRPPIEGPALLHVVGRHHDLAVVRVLEIPGATGSDLDRALALTVAELLDQVLALMRAPPQAAPPLARVLAPETNEAPRREPARPPAIADTAPPAIDPDAWGVAVELGAFGALGVETLHASIGGRGALALRYRTSGAIVEAGASLTVTAPVEAASERATVTLRSLDPALELRALARLDAALSLGGHVGVGMRALDARATAADGRTGATDALAVVVLAGPELRVALFPSAELRVALGVELATERRRFLVDDSTVLDLGWVRPFAAISIVVAVP